MNADLEKQVEEMGAEYRAVMNRLLAAQEIEPSKEIAFPAWQSRFRRCRAAYLLAASVIFVLGLSVVTIRNFSPSSSYGAREYHLTAEEMVRTQKPDGSWQNDFLTQRNAAALRDVPSAAIAYKRAVRYLRFKGLKPLS